MFSKNLSYNNFAQKLKEPELPELVSVDLPGRLMLPNHDEYECSVTTMNCDYADVICFVRPRTGERIIAYLQHIGRIEGTVSTLTSEGFLLSITATDRKKEKITAQVEWIAKRQALGLPEGRRHDRLTPRHNICDLMLNDGHVTRCKIIDLSLSGAAIEVEPRPELGTVVRLGSMNGRIVRHFVEGVAIEFDAIQSRDALMEFL